MGIFVIIMVFIFEVAFTAYCIKTKDKQNKVRSWVSIASFITFIGFTLTSIIDWSFQWYLLGFLLFILAIIGGFRLAAKKFGKKPYEGWRVVFRGISGGLSKANVDKYYCIETMNKLVLEFFNSYVKDEGSFSAKEYY